MMITGFGLMLSLVSSGCIVVIADVDEWEGSGKRVYTTTSEERSFETSGISALDIETHNGSITFDGQADGGAGQVTITKKAGGRTQAEAEAAMAAIEVVFQPKGDTFEMSWRWATPRKRGWSGDVSFAVKGPGSLNLDTETHNGPITISGASGKVDIESHNGEIKVTASGKALEVEAHNGAIDAVYSGPSVTLSAHNGAITADLSGCADVTGDVSSHNGDVQITVGQGTSAAVHARTSNGGIECSAALAESKTSRGRLDGKLGSGGGKLDIETQNGAIAIK